MTQKEILFEKEININATIKNIEKSGFGKKHIPYESLKPQLFDNVKSAKEIKKELRQELKISGDIYVFYFLAAIWLIPGVAIGFLIGCPHLGLALVTVLYLLALFIILFLFFVYVFKKRNKRIFFFTPNTVIFTGDFTKEYINNFKKLMVWKKPKVKKGKKKKG